MIAGVIGHWPFREEDFPSKIVNTTILDHVNQSGPPILYFPIPHNTLCLPPKFYLPNYASTIVFKMLLGVRAFENNNLYRILGANSAM